MIIYALVEGPTDEAMARRLAETSGHQVGACYGKRGSSWIKAKVEAFNKSAASIPVLTLLDFMDADLPCPPEILDKWLPHRHSRMIFRVVVRELESWLLADREGTAGFLGVALSKVPLSPEQLDDPKQTLVNLARQSRYSSIRSALVPQKGSTAQVGRSYVSEINRFTSEIWCPERARELSPSLNSCLRRLAEIK
ncbi:DUF4276 family protein [Desulfonatronum parangueonense]